MSGGGGSPAPFSSPDPFAGQIFGSGAPLGGDLEGSGSAAGGPTDRCLSLRFTARLRSVNPDEVELVGVGDVLVVELFSADRPQIGAFRTLAEGSRLFRADQPVGVLLERLVELLPCLNRRSYVAVVDEVDGGNVVVSVQPDLVS